MSQPPHLSLCLSSSPLLSDSHLPFVSRDLEFFLAKRNLNLLRVPAASDLYTLSSFTTSNSSTSSTASFSSWSTLPTIGISPSDSKPLPSLPNTEPISPQAIISFLDLLAVLDAEVAYEVARVTDHIKEARVMIDTYKSECAERKGRIRETRTARE